MRTLHNIEENNKINENIFCTKIASIHPNNGVILNNKIYFKQLKPSLKNLNTKKNTIIPFFNILSNNL